MGNYRQLRVWEKSKKMAVEVYRITQAGPFKKDFRFRDQLRSAAVSISANIAEGEALNTDKQAIRHFYISKGSCAECYTLFAITLEIGYIDKPTYDRFQYECQRISIMLHNLIQARYKNI